MSYPGFINGLEIFGPPLPPALLAQRLASVSSTRKGRASSGGRVLVERPKKDHAQQSSGLHAQLNVVRCTTCNNLELRRPGYKRQFPSESKSIDVNSLRETAANGCTACWTLLEGITRSNVSLEGIDHVTLNTRSASSPLVMIIGDKGAWVDNTYLEYYTKPGK